MPPGAFRLALAYAVFVSHTLPLKLGLAAVFLFFALSGFWIFQMWTERYAFTQAPYRTFIVSRFWRLIPGFYLQLVILIAILLLFPPDLYRSPVFPFGRLELPNESSRQSVHMLVSHLALLGYANLEKAERIMGPAWSLDIELQFYLIAPMLIWIVARGGVYWKVALYGVAGLGLIDYLATHGAAADSGALPLYLLFFVLGMEAAARKSPPGNRGAVWASAFAVGAFLITLMLPMSRSLILEGSFSTSLCDYNVCANVTLALGLCPYALTAARKRAANPRFDRDLGNVTYVVYLMHMSFVALIAHFEGNWSRYQQLPTIVACWTAVLPAAWVAYKLFDQPIDRLRQAYVRSRRIGRTEKVAHGWQSLAAPVGALPSVD